MIRRMGLGRGSPKRGLGTALATAPLLSVAWFGALPPYVAAAVADSAVSQPAYTFVDLGTNFYPVDLNNVDQVVGSGAVWSNGTKKALKNVNGDPRVPSPAAINDAGEVAGTVNFGTEGSAYAAWWDPGWTGAPHLATVPGGGAPLEHSHGFDLNASGDMVESLPTGTGKLGYRTSTSTGTTTQVGTAYPLTNKSDVGPTGISDDGHILTPIIIPGDTAGTFVVNGDYLLPSAGEAGVELDFEPVNHGGLTPDGRVLGYTFVSAGQIQTTIRHADGSLHQWTTPVVPTESNDSDVVAGYETVGGNLHAAVLNNGVVTDLNTYAPANWTLSQTTAINAHGDIVGIGTLSGVQHGFLLQAPRTVTVNSTANRKESATAPVGKCDTGQVITGGDAECTLRAALEVVNDGGATKVEFDIPGGGTPTISPASALPKVTESVDIDASTQPGGWVVLSGAGAGAVDGLELDAVGSTLRGMVINGFSSGSGVVTGGLGGVQHIAGNRIGTNAAGTAAVPNQIGVFIKSPDVRVGGTVGTSSGACTGDCNLIAGNAAAQVANYVLGAGGPAPAFIAADISGDWIGVDATGMAALNAPSAAGIEMFWAPATPFTTSDVLRIGGVTTQPGTAPGNLIAGGKWGIVVGNTSSPDHKTGRVAIAGNLVGLNRPGSAAVGAGDTGILAEGETLSDPDAILIGGATEGSRNIVGGWKLGILGSSGVTIDHARIGTNISGTAAVPNERGIESGGVTISNSQVSGNGTGIDIQSGGAVLASGNLVGLTANGTSALPNDVGIGNPDGVTPTFINVDLGRSHIAGPLCTTAPCNVISGNHVAGLRLHASFVQLDMAGTYVGTDITGTSAIPNGVGLDVQSRDFRNIEVGGASGVVAGQPCAYPCNLFAGNLGPGMKMTSTVTPADDAEGPDGSIQGNLVGLAANGTTMLNTGPQINVGGTPYAYTDLVIGGNAPNTGNLIASDASPAIAIGGTNTAYPTVTAARNAFWRLGTVAAITRPFPSVRPPLLASYTVDGPTVTVTGSTNVAADPFKDPERIEIYVGTDCKTGVLLPAGLGTADKLNGNFAVKIPSAALVGRPVITALRTDQARSTSQFADCLTGPTVTAATAGLKSGDMELDVKSNHGWSAGDYAEIDLKGNPVIRKVDGLGSLILAAPVPKHVPAGTVVTNVAPPKGDRKAPSIKQRGGPKRLSFSRKEKVKLRFRCRDHHGVGVEQCPKSVRLKTKKPGRHKLVVTAWDRNGNARTKRLHYSVHRSN
jgi:hypothetical protein